MDAFTLFSVIGTAVSLIGFGVLFAQISSKK